MITDLDSKLLLITELCMELDISKILFYEFNGEIILENKTYRNVDYLSSKLYHESMSMISFEPKKRELLFFNEVFSYLDKLYNRHLTNSFVNKNTKLSKKILRILTKLMKYKKI